MTALMILRELECQLRRATLTDTVCTYHVHNEGWVSNDLGV